MMDFLQMCLELENWAERVSRRSARHLQLMLMCCESDDCQNCSPCRTVETTMFSSCQHQFRSTAVCVKWRDCEHLCVAKKCLHRANQNKRIFLLAHFVAHGEPCAYVSTSVGVIPTHVCGIPHGSGHFGSTVQLKNVCRVLVVPCFALRSFKEEGNI